jgi:hypothetical protein
MEARGIVNLRGQKLTRSATIFGAEVIFNADLPRRSWLGRWYFGTMDMAGAGRILLGAIPLIVGVVPLVWRRHGWNRKRSTAYD